MEKFINFIANILNVEVNSIDLNTGYQSIPEWDSLMHIRIVAEIEEEYKVGIPIDEIDLVLTINDLYEYIIRGN